MKNIKTRNGVYLNTKDSVDYYFIYKDYKIFFSSIVYLNKFKEKISRYTYEENMKINNRYKIKIDLMDYLILSCYKSIEKRGYKIENIKTKEVLIEGNTIDIKFCYNIEK